MVFLYAKLTTVCGWLSVETVWGEGSGGQGPVEKGEKRDVPLLFSAIICKFILSNFFLRIIPEDVPGS